MDLIYKLSPAQVVYTENDDTMSEMAAQFLRQDRKCLCFLRGASKERFTEKIMCALAGVAYEKTQDGSIVDKEWAKLFAAADRLLCGNVQIDSTAMSDEAILAKCKHFPSADVVLILPLAK